MTERSAGPFSTIKYEVDGHKATITLNRPDALNALSPFMITELRSAYAEVEADDNIWLMIVTAAGRAFCTGADVSEIPGDGKVLNERPYLSTYEQWEAPQEGTPPFRQMAKPVLVAINGICSGPDWTGSPPVTSSSPRTNPRSSTRTSASGWWPVEKWYDWPEHCPARWHCGWR
jgi:1,4-dihydroxy-2-naphthoyl-CoA synthase